MILVLGIGNDILTDDGIGPALVRDLAEVTSNPDVRFETATIGGLDLMELLSGFDKVILIDAIRNHDGIPGTVYFFHPDDFRETMNLSNLHDISFLNALSLANRLQLKVPRDITIIAVEILEDRVFSDVFSEQLQEKYPKVLKEVSEYLYSECIFVQ
ncbi:MAG: hydrogenase maturation protease [Bacteroidota bacterium]